MKVRLLHDLFQPLMSFENNDTKLKVITTKTYNNTTSTNHTV